MGFYKNIFKKKIVIAGRSKGASPSYLMPPNAADTKQGYQIYEAVDLLCEGEVAGLVSQEGKILSGGSRVQKTFNQDANVIGGTVLPIDQGIYFNEIALRDSAGNSTHSKYDIEFKSGKILQDYCSLVSNPSRLKKLSHAIKGPYNMGTIYETRTREIRSFSWRTGYTTTTVQETVDVSLNGSRTGKGSRDIRTEGTSARDFVNWQRYVPIEQAAKPFTYTNYDKDIDKIDIGLQIDGLNDTRSYSTKSENYAGKSKMGSPMPLTITFNVKVGKSDKDGVITEQAAVFAVRPGKGKTVGEGNGKISIRGVITAPYTVTLENITLPVLSDTDIYNFIEVSKVEHETISNLVSRDGGVGTVTEKYDDTFYYPGSCYVASQVDSQYHPQVPSRTFRLKGKKIKIPNNYNPIVTNSSDNTDGIDRRFSSDTTTTRGNVIYDGDWDGTFKYEWSDNPAWIYYDLLTNKRYGLGSYLQDVDIIDKWTLYEIGMYCDAVTMNDGSKTTNDMGGAGRFIGLDDGFGGLEPRFSCNILMKDQTDAFDAIQNLARSFRAMTYFNNSCVSVRVDRPYFFEDFNNTTNSAPKENKFPAHLIFNNLSVKDGMFSYADVDRSTKLSAVEVSFLDKRNNFTSQTEYVEDPEAIKHVGLNFKQVEGIGVTSKAQAHRLAKYILFESMHTTETISFNAGLEALLVQPGDIIRVEDEMRNFTRNYGTVLGASGVTDYYDPDGTGNIDTLNSGKGPSAIIVEPAIGSDLTDYVTGGNIHIYNPVGKSGIEDFYRSPTTQNNELYKEIHNPQVMSLKIKPGGSGSSYEIVDSGVAVFINGLETFINGNTGSQWFSEKDANIKHGSIYNIDSSGRDPKYYRVLNISEDKNLGFNVSATIHHTGKFKFVEENVSFDVGKDAFQPSLSLTNVIRPFEPSSVTAALVSGQGKTKNVNLTILDPADATKAPEKYIVILEEPDSTTIVSEHFKSSTTTTLVTLSGDSKIDQIGTYNISVFSENTTPTIARSSNATNATFTTDINTFSFNDQEAFTEYSKISIKTDFTSTFDNSAETGVAQNSFFQNDSSVNVVVDLEFEDIFENTGFAVQQNVLEQKINILDIQGNLKSGNFKSLTNDSSFTITNNDVNEIFGYTGEERYRVPSGLNFEVGSFQIDAGTTSTSVQTVNFQADFSGEVPAVFIQQKVSGSFNDVYRPLGRQYTKTDGTKFFVKSSEENSNKTHYAFVASKTGNYAVDSKKIKIDFVNKNNSTGYQDVTFDQPFASIPTVVIQLQQTGGNSSERITSETCITGVTADGFSFAAFQDNGSAAGGTGKYAYIAVDQLAFNNTTATDLPVTVLNYASTGNQDYAFGSPILNEFNGSESSVTDSLFNHDQYAVLCQRSGEDVDLENKFFIVHETGNQNKLYQHSITTGLDNGIRASQTNGANNHILLTGTNLTVGTEDFTMFAWARFDSSLDGKQYLLESHKNGTGIAWFQSGDGKNYVNLNGVDHLAITGNGGASLNDGNLHSLYVEVTRDTSLKGYVDGALSITNSQILQHFGGFTVGGVGSGMPQNPYDFNGAYTKVGNLYQNTTSNSLKIKTSGANNTWILVDEDTTSTRYSHTPIAWSGGENISNPANVTSWTGAQFYSGFTVADVGSGMVNNTGDFDGEYTGSVDLYVNTTTSGLRIKKTGSDDTWILCDDDPANNYYTGFTLGSVGSGMVDNPNSFNGTYTGGAGLYVNTTTSGLRMKTTGTNNTWILCDDDPANSYSHNRIAWSGGENVDFPGNVADWTGGATILDGTITDSLAPTFTLLLSHDRIAWSGGKNIHFPWNVGASNWTGGSAIQADSNVPAFSQILQGDYPGTSAPTFLNAVVETFDSQTGFKVLGNSILPGNSLTSGHIMKYIGLTTGQETQSTHFSNPNTFKNNKKVLARTKFLLEVDSESYFEDISTDNTASGSIVGSVEKSKSIINRNKLSNFDFLQIGVTGSLTTL
jgi:hypothetical protein